MAPLPLFLCRPRLSICRSWASLYPPRSGRLSAHCLVVFPFSIRLRAPCLPPDSQRRTGLCRGCSGCLGISRLFSVPAPPPFRPLRFPHFYGRFFSPLPHRARLPRRITSHLRPPAAALARSFTGAACGTLATFAIEYQFVLYPLFFGHLGVRPEFILPQLAEPFVFAAVFRLALLPAFKHKPASSYDRL